MIVNLDKRQFEEAIFKTFEEIAKQKHDDILVKENGHVFYVSPEEYEKYYKNDFDYVGFHGEVLDFFDLLPNDVKCELLETKLGEFLEKRLQEVEVFDK